MQSLELRVPPLALTLVVALAMTAVAQVLPAAAAGPWRLAAAVVLGFAGTAVALAGVAAFRRHRTTVNPLDPLRSSTLVSTGIYRHSRNPMYLGFLLALTGWALFLGSWASAAFLPGFIAYLTRFQIRPEERALTERFEQAFLDYRRSVRRWL